MAESTTSPSTAELTVAQAEEALSSAKALCEATEQRVAEARMDHMRAVSAVNRATTDLWRAQAAAESNEPS